LGTAGTTETTGTGTVRGGMMGGRVSTGMAGMDVTLAGPAGSVGRTAGGVRAAAIAGILIVGGEE
jgi:hypothetical protein